MANPRHGLYLHIESHSAGWRDGFQEAQRGSKSSIKTDREGGENISQFMAPVNNS